MELGNTSLANIRSELRTAPINKPPAEPPVIPIVSGYNQPQPNICAIDKSVRCSFWQNFPFSYHALPISPTPRYAQWQYPFPDRREKTIGTKIGRKRIHMNRTCTIQSGFTNGILSSCNEIEFGTVFGCRPNPLTRIVFSVIADDRLHF